MDIHVSGWVGIDWYPSREWAVLLPAWSIVLVITTYIVYSSMAIAATPSFSDMSSMTDNRVLFPTDPDDHSPYLNAGSKPALYDIPIGMVNRVLQEPEDQTFQAGRIAEEKNHYRQCWVRPFIPRCIVD
ncbi:putative PIG-P [Lyophyllum shimeji]|uniref:PIG-P n=1 Tax=Lyophyllum shimeji TaxID=47721 RepID=A0A9P3URL1_LYOSH|nr:putative PIG-P [Lyophyllum shimeji]